jgi:hypothetical protein
MIEAEKEYTVKIDICGNLICPMCQEFTDMIYKDTPEDKGRCAKCMAQEESK